MQILFTRSRTCRSAAASCTLLALLLQAACQTYAPGPGPGAAALPPAPPLPVQGSTHLSVDSDASELRILVYRGGPLAQFGHNHVILAHGLQGDVYLARHWRESGFRLRIPVQDLEVDPPAARREEGAGFATQPSAQAITGTRSNMLGPAVLDAGQFPDIIIRSLAISGSRQSPAIRVRITLHGVSRDLTLPVSLQLDDSRIDVHGTAELLQSDFGITPFSVMGGGLRVQDRLLIRFHLVASRG